MTPAEKKASELANQIAKPVLRSMVSRGEAKEMCMKMAKAIFDLAEVRGLEEALSKAHECMGNAGQTAWDGDDELKRIILSSGRQQIRDAKDAWRSFRGEK